MAARRNAAWRQAKTDKPGRPGSVGHAFDCVRVTTREIVVERDDNKVELSVRCETQRRERRGEDGIGRIQVRIGEKEWASHRVGLKVEYADDVLPAGGERPRLAVEHGEVELAVAVVVDEDIELRRIVRMRPFAISVDRELNSESTAADADETRAHRLQVDDREVVARTVQKPSGYARARASERKHLHAAIYGPTRIAQEQCVSAIPMEPHRTLLGINLRGPMRQDMPGQVNALGVVRQRKVAVEFHTLQERAGAAQTPAIEVPIRKLARVYVQRHSE